MLTRDLLRYHVRKGHVRPRFVAVTDTTLLQHAKALTQTAQHSVGSPRGEVETRLAACLQDDVEPLIHRGLTKLVLDRCRFVEPAAEISSQRLALFRRATVALRGLPANAPAATLHAALGAPDVQGLYDDLPDQRPLAEFRELTACGLLQRYNLALAQGLLVGCSQLTVRTPSHDVLALRRLLRWLKFCRLVAEVQRRPEGWQIDITGPAAVFALAKAYGLQLANFLPAVPLLANYTVEAEVQVRKPHRWQLLLSDADPLVSPHAHALGHIPAEMQTLVQAFSDTAWHLSTEVEPRPVGATGMMVPDLVFRHAGGAERVVELFHRWHHHALGQRLIQLAARPDPVVLLGVDRALLRQAAVASVLAQHPEVPSFEFNGFPTPRRMRAALEQRTD